MYSLLFIGKSVQSKKIIFIFGPTASGKTDFASLVADRLPAEIINMDSAQLYTPLSIGTAKPDWRASTHMQHLFDCIDEPRYFTSYAYRNMALEKVKKIWSRNKIPMFVGGSGFYLKSLLFPSSEIGVRDVEKQIIAHDQSDLWQQLNSIDPARAQDIHPHDTYRIQRAVEIWHMTGNKPSLYKPVYDPPASFVLVFITCNKKVLYERIDQRVLVMMQMGWLQEVEALIGTPWESFVQHKGFIGYRELINHIKHSYELEHAISLIQQKTRNYAKRQDTFWRMLKKSLTAVQHETLYKGRIVEFDLTYSNVDLYIKQLLNNISGLDAGDS